MKKFLAKIAASLLMLGTLESAQATSLYSVYQDAVKNDPTFRQAVAQLKFDKEDVPLARAALLPTIALTGSGAVSRPRTSGAETINATAGVGGDSTQSNRGYSFDLTATQKLVDFGVFFNYSQAKLQVKAATATYAAALQDLMIRVAAAYFDVLNAQEIVRFEMAQKEFLSQNLDQAKEKFKVGLNTITDVNLAQADYSASLASSIAAENELSNKQEDLRAITGRYYPSLSVLKEKFPLISPEPLNIDDWVNAATQHNWLLQAARLNADAAHKGIQVAWSGHLPTLNLEGSYENRFNRNSEIGSGKTYTPTAALNLSVPLFSGGSVVSNTRRAVANYENFDQQKEFALRNTVNVTRKTYLGVLAIIAQIKADQKAIEASKSALDGLEAGYALGTETMVDVLQGQEDLFDNQTTYATDRYTYLLTTLQLKQAAGTLSAHDLQAIDAWFDPAKT